MAARLSLQPDAVKNVTIWGNHSSTQFPDVTHAYVLQDGQKKPVYDAVQDDAWLKGDFIKVSMCVEWSQVRYGPVPLAPLYSVAEAKLEPIRVNSVRYLWFQNIE